MSTPPSSSPASSSRRSRSPTRTAPSPLPDPRSAPARPARAGSRRRTARGSGPRRFRRDDRLRRRRRSFSHSRGDGGLSARSRDALQGERTARPASARAALPGAAQPRRDDDQQWRVLGCTPAQDAVTVDARTSSQYASALVIAACMTGRRFTVRLDGPAVSRGYLELTLRWARHAGFQVDDRQDTILIEPGAPQTLPPIPSDWSSLGYLLLMGRASGSEVRTHGAGEHPDKVILEHLETSAPLEVLVSRAPVRPDAGRARDDPQRHERVSRSAGAASQRERPPRGDPRARLGRRRAGAAQRHDARGGRRAAPGALLIRLPR